MVMMGRSIRCMKSVCVSNNKRALCTSSIRARAKPDEIAGIFAPRDARPTAARRAGAPAGPCRAPSVDSMLAARERETHTLCKSGVARSLYFASVGKPQSFGCVGWGWPAAATVWAVGKAKAKHCRPPLNFLDRLNKIYSPK